MHVQIRKASAQDAAALGRLRLRGVTELGHNTMVDDRDFVAAFISWVHDHLVTHLAFLAELDDEVVGMAWLMVAERVPNPQRQHRRTGDVQSVYVVPEMRDRGIGAALLQAVLAEAGELGLEHVTVHSSNRALPLYERAGFQHDQRWLRWQPE